MKDNPPAFPCEAQQDRSVPPEHDYLQTGIHSGKFPGMSLRDWFAGQVAPAIFTQIVEERIELQDRVILPQAVAITAYQLADAMLAERAKGHQS